MTLSTFAGDLHAFVNEGLKAGLEPDEVIGALASNLGVMVAAAAEHDPVRASVRAWEATRCALIAMDSAILGREESR